jgi:DNA sulfur modification protein DndE
MQNTTKGHFMKNSFVLSFCFLISIPLACFSQSIISDAEAEAIAIDAYIYGYPLITMDVTRQVMTNTENSTVGKAPMGQFGNLRTYPNADFKDVTTPNADTLYSIAWLDLSKEPYILHVPEEGNRYYLMPMLSAWTNIFAAPGTRTTGTQAGDYAITGPKWNGTLPDGVKEFKSPTNLVWVLGRTYSTGTPEDYKLVHAIQDQYSVKPLSYFGKDYTPPKGSFNPKIDMKTPVRDQVNYLDAVTFFNRMMALMVENPPAHEDAPILERISKIGIVAGHKLEQAQLNPNIARVLQLVPRLAQEKILAHVSKAGKTINGWDFILKTGQYGTDYLQRAFIAAVGLGANLPEDAIYPSTHVDSRGQQLDGTYKYVIHFEKGQMPPVKGFWSLTLYNNQYFFVKNPLNRYNLSSRDPFKYNSDGSLDLYIQNSPPDKEKEANWLPAPKGPFVLTFRFYWPEKELLDGMWKPPIVQNRGISTL